MFIVVKGFHDHGTARQAEEAVLGANKYLHAFGVFGRLQQAGQAFAGFQRLKEGADVLQILDDGDVFQQLRLATDDKVGFPRRVAHGGDPGPHHTGGEIVEPGLVFLDFLENFAARLVERAPHKPGIEIIPCLDQGRWHHTRGNFDDAVFHQAVIRHHDHKGAGAAQVNEFYMFQRAFRFRRQNQAGAMGQAREHFRGFLKNLRGTAARGVTAAFDPGAVFLRQRPQFQQPVHEKTQPRFRGQPPGRGMGGVKQAHILKIGHDIADGSRGQGAFHLFRQYP